MVPPYKSMPISRVGHLQSVQPSTQCSAGVGVCKGTKVPKSGLVPNSLYLVRQGLYAKYAENSLLGYECTVVRVRRYRATAWRRDKKRHRSKTRSGATRLGQAPAAHDHHQQLCPVPTTTPICLVQRPCWCPAEVTLNNRERIVALDAWCAMRYTVL